MNDKAAMLEEAEFSALADLRQLTGSAKAFRLSASSEERSGVSRRLGVRHVKTLEGEATLFVTKTHIKASGVLRAVLMRECVASLEEMTERIEEPFEIEFLRVRPALSSKSLDVEEEDLDAPEIYEGDVFDLGELLTQQLSLAMSAFPRKEGAASLAEEFGEDKPVSPFAALAKDL